MSTDTIDVETTVTPGPGQNMALERRPEQQAVGKALSIEQLHERLEFIRNVMKREMKEGTDYGKIPGTGDKPSLLQPGAQKLLMTFNLREQVKKEVLRELPHPTVSGHREYEFTITVFPAGGRPEDGWDGVGTCSTLESKYRYRKAERVCPSCKKNTIIAENPKFVPAGEIPGFLCWKKKGGCGAHFADNDPAITGQPTEDVENEDPADVWNTVRKMSFKRALIHAGINATNTSELWTADLEDMSENEAARPKKTAANAPRNDFKAQGAPNTPPRGQSPQARSPVKPTEAKKTPPPPADEQTRAKMIRKLDSCLDLATEYFRKLEKPAVLLDTETLEDLPLQFVPITVRQFEALQDCITAFGNGEEARHAYPPNERPAEPPEKKPTPPKPSVEAAKKKDPEWFWEVVITVPRKGMKKTEYDASPDTIGSLYEALKNGDEEAGHRLWGLAKNWDCKPREYNGRVYSPSDADRVCRQALDDFVDFEEAREQEADDVPL